MNLKTIIIFFAIGLVISLTSCQTDQELPSVASGTAVSNVESGVRSSSSVVYKYFLDSKQISASRYTLMHDSVTTWVAANRSNPNTADTEINIYGYSSTSRFADLALQDSLYRIKPQALLQFENTMRAYANQSGAIVQYENNGTIPSSYMAYEQSQYQQIFGKPHRSEIADFKVNYEDSLFRSLPSPAVVMPNSLNNNVSGYLSDKEKTTVIYNDPFYRSRMLILYGITAPEIDLTGPLSFTNDRTSAVLTY